MARIVVLRGPADEIHRACKLLEETAGLAVSDFLLVTPEGADGQQDAIFTVRNEGLDFIRTFGSLEFFSATLHNVVGTHGFLRLLDRVVDLGSDNDAEPPDSAQ
jgi:hypothetical protein